MAPSKTTMKTGLDSKSSGKGKEPLGKKSADVNRSKPVDVVSAPSHPKYSEMIRKAVEQGSQKEGLSRQAILKFITSNYSVGSTASRVVNTTLRKMCEEKLLEHANSSSQGASGSFRFPKKSGGSQMTVTSKSESADAGKIKVGSKSAEPKISEEPKVTGVSKRSKDAESTGRSKVKKLDVADDGNRSKLEGPKALGAKVAPSRAPLVSTSSDSADGQENVAPAVEVKRKVAKPRVPVTPAIKKAKVSVRSRAARRLANH